MAKVLVTGGAGFVGRHCVGRLLARGDEVHCVDPIVPLTGGLPLDKWPFFNPRDYKNFHFHQEDCRTWFKRVQDNDFDYAFHLAAMVGGRMMIVGASAATWGRTGWDGRVDGGWPAACRMPWNWPGRWPPGR